MASPQGARPESDIYSVLLVIGSLVSIGGLVFMYLKAQELFGDWTAVLPQF